MGRLSTDFLTEESKAHASSVLKEFRATGYCHRVAYQMVCTDVVKSSTWSFQHGSSVTRKARR